MAEATQTPRIGRRFAIKGIWYDQKHIDALRAIVPDGYTVRRRARGYRFGKRHYHQSFPLNMCAYFTMYCEPNVHWRDRGPDWYEILQVQFRGFTDDGKPILRYPAPPGEHHV